jgi:hypothetical protein
MVIRKLSNSPVKFLNPFAHLVYGFLGFWQHAQAEILITSGDRESRVSLCVVLNINASFFTSAQPYATH